MVPVPGVWELVIIGGIIVLMFGTAKLPKLGGAIGESIKNFKKGIKDQEKLDAGGEKLDDSPEKKPEK